MIAVVLLMMINFIINYHHEVTKEQHTPMADFKTKVEMAPMKEYNDPSSVEFITEENGNVSVLIKNIGYLKARI